MVLTNFECWAHGEDIGAMWNAVIDRRNAPLNPINPVDLFNPNSAVECSETDPPKCVSHLSSNGYYGFAPIRQTVTEETATKTTLPHQQNEQSASAPGECVQMMDVEQHRPEIVDLNNGFNVRRKRIFVEEECFQIHRRDAKRCRFDRQREEYCAENNIGFFDSTLPPNTFQTMDHDEFPPPISQSSDVQSPKHSTIKQHMGIWENPKEIAKRQCSNQEIIDNAKDSHSKMYPSLAPYNDDIVFFNSTKKMWGEYFD